MLKEKCDIGIIGAMDAEIKRILASLSGVREDTVGSFKFYIGDYASKHICLVRCGIGKVFAAICTQTMILAYAPSLIVNTGVGGALKAGLNPCDIVVAKSLVQHDMDTSPLGDPKGLVSGINKIFFGADHRACEILEHEAHRLGYTLRLGIIATGDRFIASAEDKNSIVSTFDADCCEMEGCAVAQTAFVGRTPFAVIRAISDTADGSSSMDYASFLPIAAERSAMLTLALVKDY